MPAHEVAASKTMLDRTEEHLGFKPERLAAYMVMAQGSSLAWVIGKGTIIPHIPVWDMSKREGMAASRAPTLRSIGSAMSTPALWGSRSRLLARFTPIGRSCTSPPHVIVEPVR